MRGKIVDYYFDDGALFSSVTKATPYGTFSATALAAEEDEDIATMWDGLKFAEMKCDIQAMHEKARRMRQRAIGAENALKALDNIGTCDPYTLDMLERQVWTAYNEADKYKEVYEEMRDSYKAYTNIILRRRRELRNKVNESKSAD